MRVLVCGGRDYHESDTVWMLLNDFAPTVVIHGACPRGADKAADQWAKRMRRSVEAFPADWDTHGRAAGPIRNQRMLDEGKPDLVLAFPGGRGTADMVRRAKKAGVRVIEVKP